MEKRKESTLMQQRLITIGAIFAGLGVAIGAFGAHGLTSILETNGRADTFDTATQYHLYHALAIILVAWLLERYPDRLMKWAGIFFIVGILLFSGSLYVLAIFDIGFMGAIAPFGGAAFILGWGCLGLAAWRGQYSPH